MEIRLTAVDPRVVSVPVDLAVTASEDATAADLWAPLCLATGSGHRDPMRLFVDGAPLPEQLRVGAAPLLDGATVSIGAPGMTPPRRVPGLLELHVVGGPDSGQVLRLTPGTHRVGRAAEASLRLDDADVSRVHAEVVVAHGGVMVADLASTNGTFLDGVRLGRDQTAMSASARLVVGSSTLLLRVPGDLPAATRPDGHGHIEVNRSPRILPPVRVVEIRLPAKPQRRQGARLPMIAMLLPLLLSVLMAKLLHSPTFLLFGLMSPLMVLGTWLGDRRSGKQGNARSRADFEASTLATRVQISEALREETRRRRASLPDHAALLLTASGPSSRIWERRRQDDDLLHLRLGTRRLPSCVTVVDPDSPGGNGNPEVDDVPVCLPLAAVGVVGIAGPRDRVVGVVRALLAQVGGWHSPRDVSLRVLAAEASTAADWAWTAHLPHSRPGREGDCHNFVGILGGGSDQVQRRVVELTALLDERKSLSRNAVGGDGWHGQRVVVLLDGAQRLRAVPGVSQLLEEGPAVGICFVCVDTHPARLPVESHGTVLVGDGGAGSMLRLDLAGHAPLPDIQGDLVSSRWVERFARSLAPLRDATPEQDEGQVPERSRLLGLLDLDATDGDTVAARWLARPRSTLALLGESAAGPHTVDLSRDGPHALVGGTTGSGKSELLQTLIASLALGNRPDEMSFVLVDYKGGSAFKDCARLPHTVGLVTDLDGHLTERALTSLEAELKRREQMLRAQGVKDIEDYQAAVRPGGAPMPRLVLVIDEFKMLAEDLPGFVDGLVRIAAVGRSLGVHLILATQRPGGIVSSDIKANVNLRIALRVRDRVDSEDVIEAADAATISERTPGRAYLRSGANPLVMLQTARVAGHGPDAAPSQVRMRSLSWGSLGDPPPRPVQAGPDSRPSDLARIVDATSQAARALGIPRRASPWLAPLTDVVTADTLPASGWQIPYGTVDLPREQTQRPVVWDLEHDGHLAIAGTARTGRTTALRTIAGMIASRFAPTDVHIYGIDGTAGGLLPVTALPHTGAVVTRGQLGRTDRLIQRLHAEVQRRQTWLAERGYISLVEQRGHAASCGDPALPYLVLLVDGWDAVTAALDELDHGRPMETLIRILREGAAAGVRAVVTGDRSVLLSKIASVIPDKLVLRMADPTDLVMAGIAAKAVPVHQPAGRAIRTSDSAELQLAVLTGDLAGPAQVAALAALGQRCRDGAGDLPRSERPFRVEPLPTRIAAAQVEREAGRIRPSPTWALIGVGGDELEPVGVDVGLEGSAVLVAGPPGSGRSSALSTMARSLAAQAVPVALVAPRRSPLQDLSDLPGVLCVLEPSGGGRLRELLAEHRQLAVIADDAELLLDTPIEDVLLEMARSTSAGAGAVICSGTSSELAALYRGITVEVRKRQLGVLLNPTGYADGDLFGIRVCKGEELVPGRGLLIDRNRVTPIQVALPS